MCETSLSPVRSPGGQKEQQPSGQHPSVQGRAEDWRPEQSVPALCLTASPLPNPPEMYELGWKSRGQAVFHFTHSLTTLAAGCWLSLEGTFIFIFFFFLLAS